MIIDQKDLSKTTKLLWVFALVIGLGFGTLLALFLLIAIAALVLNTLTAMSAEVVK